MRHTQQQLSSKIHLHGVYNYSARFAWAWTTHRIPSMLVGIDVVCASDGVVLGEMDTFKGIRPAGQAGMPHGVSGCFL